MAATSYKDRISETSTFTGGGPVALLGAVNGFADFTRFAASQSGIPVLMEAIDAAHAPTGQWEVAMCTLSADRRTLTRDTVRDSSNAGATVSFAAGTKRVSVVNDGLSIENRLIAQPLTGGAAGWWFVPGRGLTFSDPSQTTETDIAPGTDATDGGAAVFATGLGYLFAGYTDALGPYLQGAGAPLWVNRTDGSTTDTIEPVMVLGENKDPVLTSATGLEVSYDSWWGVPNARMFLGDSFAVGDAYAEGAARLAKGGATWGPGLELDQKWPSSSTPAGSFMITIPVAGAGPVSFLGYQGISGYEFDGNIAVDGSFNRIGPQSGAAADNVIYLDNTSNYNWLIFRHWISGAPTTNATIYSVNGDGLSLNGYPHVTIRVGADGAAENALYLTTDTAQIYGPSINLGDPWATVAADLTIQHYHTNYYFVDNWTSYRTGAAIPVAYRIISELVGGIRTDAGQHTFRSLAGAEYATFHSQGLTLNNSTSSLITAGTAAAPADVVFYFDTTNYYNLLFFRKWNGTTYHTHAQITGADVDGLNLSGYPNVTLYTGTYGSAKRAAIFTPNQIIIDHPQVTIGGTSAFSGSTGNNCNIDLNCWGGGPYAGMNLYHGNVDGSGLRTMGGFVGVDGYGVYYTGIPNLSLRCGADSVIAATISEIDATHALFAITGNLQVNSGSAQVAGPIYSIGANAGVSIDPRTTGNNFLFYVDAGHLNFYSGGAIRAWLTDAGAFLASGGVNGNSGNLTNATARNPGVYSYNNAGDITAGMELGYNSGYGYTNRIFTHPSWAITLCGITGGGNLQSHFEDWAVVSAGGINLPAGATYKVNGVPIAGGGSDATKANLAGGNTFTGDQQFRDDVYCVSNLDEVNPLYIGTNGGGNNGGQIVTKGAGGANIATLSTIYQAAGYCQFAFKGWGAGGPQTLGVWDYVNGLLLGTKLTVPDDAYAAGWDGNFEVPTKNAIYDKIQTLGAGGGVTTNPLTINNAGTGAASGATFNGSAPITLSYNSIGAARAGSVTVGDLTINTGKLAGRTTAAAGAIEEITPGATMTLAAGALGVAKVPTAITVSNAGGGAASGSTFDGSVARTISYNSVGATRAGLATAGDLTMNTGKVLGRTTAAAGAIEELTPGATMTLTAGALNVAKVPNALTGNNSGTGVASGGTYDGSAAVTFSWNTLGAAPDAPRTQAAAAESITPTFSNDVVQRLACVASITLNNPTGTAVDNWGLVVKLRSASAQALSYGTQYRAVGVVLPAATIAGKLLILGMIWNVTDTKFDVVAVAQEA